MLSTFPAPYALLARVGAVSAVVGPLCLLAADVLQVLDSSSIGYTLAFSVGFAFTAAAVIGVTFLASARTPKLALVGGVLAFVGCIAGASMQVAFRTFIWLADAGFTPAREHLMRSPALTFTTLAPGIAFPIGLIVLAAALFRCGSIPRWTSLVLLIGAVCFPIGHAANIVPFLVLSTTLIAAAFAVLAPRIGALGQP